MQHYGAASTIYNFGNVGFGQQYSRADWGGRIAAAQYAITQAKSTSPVAFSALVASEAHVMKARNVHDYAKSRGLWTDVQEEAITEHLERAHGAYRNAQIMAGPVPLPAWPTWRGAAMGIPSGGVVPPIIQATKEEPTAPVPVQPYVPAAAGVSALSGAGGFIAGGLFLLWLLKKG